MNRNCFINQTFVFRNRIVDNDEDLDLDRVLHLDSNDRGERRLWVHKSDRLGRNFTFLRSI